MKLKGIVRIIITCAITGKIKKDIIQNNLIPDASWVGVLDYDAVNNYFGSKRISIATDNTTPVANVSTVTGVIGTCATPSGVTSPAWIETSDPPYGIIIGRIDPVGTSRTFNSVALTALSAANVQSIALTQAFARLLLDIPCTQGVNDFVNITYAIQFLDNVGDGLVNKMLNRYEFGRALFTATATTRAQYYRMGNLYANPCNPIFNALFLPPAGTIVGERTPNTVLNQTWTSGTTVADHFKYKYKKTIDKNTFNGVIFNAMPQGLSNNGNYCYAVTKFKQYTREPFQAGFKKSSLSQLPFFDASNIASSQGKIILSGTWSGKFPELYRITFTASGATGIATYKLSVLKHVGFSGNTLTCADIQPLYRVPDIQYASGLHGWKDEDFDVHRLSNTEIVQYDTNGVSVIDLVDGTFKNFDFTTTPALPVSQVRQIAVDVTNRLIYVACRTTGLWIINLTANTVTQQFAVACYGVDVGRNNIAIAIIEGSLRRSTDWSISASFTFATITDGNWSRVRFLKADPEQANDRIAIIADNGSGINRVVWYQFSDGVSTLGYSSGTNVKPWAASLDVSDTGSNWIIFTAANNAAKLTYGTSTLGTAYTPFNKTINHSVWGNQAFSKVSFYKDSYIGFSQLEGGTVTADYTNFPSNISFALHLDSGLTLTNQFIRQIFSGLPLLFTNYGWNGSAWVEGGAGSKTTHTDAQALLNGLTIRFQDGASIPHFVINEQFTQGINWGQLKDNATDIELNRAWYSKAIHIDAIAPTTITTTVTLPAQSDPYFRRVDTDTVEVHSFLIDSVAVTKIWTDSTNPAATEVRLAANGTLTFNSADAGKSLTGYYLWIEI